MKVSSLPKQEISCNKLEALYFREKRSVSYIAKIFDCSENKINYWLEKCEIPKRSISEAIYHLKNPKGDPFVGRQLVNIGNLKFQRIICGMIDNIS